MKELDDVKKRKRELFEDIQTQKKKGKEVDKEILREYRFLQREEKRIYKSV